MSELITGIQQVGIGVEDADEAKILYRELFGMDVLIFDDRASASLMTQYTGNTLHQRRALLCMNMRGGGGFEIWQFTSRSPAKCNGFPNLGDLGIFAVKIKSADVESAHRYFTANFQLPVSAITQTEDGRPAFWLIDKYGNRFQIIEETTCFKKGKHVCGGVIGAVIGVSDMQRSIFFYKSLLGISTEIYNTNSTETDNMLGGRGPQQLRKVLLKKNASVNGAFSKLLGHIEIELVQSLDRTPEKIYHQRYWGDCGFIHLCFDVLNMNLLKDRSLATNYPFTVDSADSFSMGSSAGRFCYVEDPDGTLIELVETHKVPVLKKIGLFINLKKRKHNKPLPDWMVGLLALNKVK
jgi:catechol 2,3-dioxygenase-like lactoylglutathione lyase family enzyme